ncbi:MAG: aspartate/glutamate racemase family protein [Caldimonas sp.]
MDLLVLNPNTSESISVRLGHHVAAAIAALDPSARVRTATAAFGASYIADETSFAIAGHAALDAAATAVARHGEPDALLLGCFGDPGIEALREFSACPVVGLAEASMREAAKHGRFAIVTGGRAWAPMLERIARGLGHGAALTGVHTVSASGAELAADPAAAIDLLRNACIAASHGANAVILGGAGLAGLAEPIASSLGVPLIDSVAAGARALWVAATEGRSGSAPSRAASAIASRAQWQGLSAPLMDRLG